LAFLEDVLEVLNWVRKVLSQFPGNDKG